MAELWVRNSLSSSVAVKFNISLRQYVLKSSEGDLRWVMEIGTTHLDGNGDHIPHKTIYNLTEDKIDLEIQNAISELCTYIDWGTLEKDIDAPYASEYSPTGSNTPIRSLIKATIEEALPSSGIDLSDISVVLNNGDVDFDITDEIEIEGDPYQYKLKWTPPNF